MNRPELYYKTIDILSTAYANDTLSHQTNEPCAIGNLIAANNGYIVKYVERIFPCGHLREEFPYGFRKFLWLDQTGEQKDQHWTKVFAMGELNDMLNYEGRKQIKSTGYTVVELMKIERAFEVCSKGTTEDEYVFNGLMNVIEVLDEIHGVKNESLYSVS